MKILKRMISILLTFLLCITTFQVVFATDSIFQEAPNIDPQTIRDPTLENIPGTNAKRAAEAVSEILGYMQFICWAIVIGMILYMGIKYMMSAANERAELKNAAIRLVIGSLMIATVSTVGKIVWDIASKISE